MNPIKPTLDAPLDLVTVFRALNPMEAQMIWSRLDAAGFQAEVVHELASLSLATGGVLVQVPASQAANARELLDAENAPPQ